MLTTASHVVELKRQGAGAQRIANQLALPLHWVRFLLMEGNREQNMAEVAILHADYLRRLPASRKTMAHLPSLINAHVL